MVRAGWSLHADGARSPPLRSGTRDLVPGIVTYSSGLPVAWPRRREPARQLPDLKMKRVRFRRNVLRVGGKDGCQIANLPRRALWQSSRAGCRTRRAKACGNCADEPDKRRIFGTRGFAAQAPVSATPPAPQPIDRREDAQQCCGLPAAIVQKGRCSSNDCFNSYRRGLQSAADT